MSPGTLLIRADASAEIGWGHVMRCLALAQAWQDTGGDCVFAMAEALEPLQARLRAENIRLCVISATPGSADDAQQLSKMAQEWRARWIVVDGYNFGADYQHLLKEAGRKLLAIDDYGHSGTCIADLILDQNAGAAERFYASRPPGTKLLLGMRYTLLRREFRAWRNWKREIPPIASKILVTMGGSDPENITEHVLHALRSSQMKNLEMVVLIGGSSHLQSLRRVAQNFEPELRLLERTSNILELMAWADIAIIAGGGTLWELLYMTCPIITFARNSGQEQILSHLANQHYVEYVGTTKNLGSDRLSSVVLDLASSVTRRRAMSDFGREIVDGLGAERICELMINEHRVASQSEVDTCIAARS